VSAPYLEVREVVRRFPGPRRGWLRRAGPPVTAVAGVSFTVEAGGAFGLVGESGSGKTTLARIVSGLLSPSAGEVRVGGEPAPGGGTRERRRLWRRVQYVHQNPRGALNPRLRVGRIVGGPLESLLGLSGEERDARVRDALARVGLDADAALRHPHAFSGGQAQRIAIARAVVVEPELLILDEPTSALDVRVQAEVLALLARLRETLGTTLLFISHDVPVVASLCSRIGVMHRGALVEEGPRRQVLEAPRHAYTRELLSAVPTLGRATG
jgi:peptide/nickel transport system ATP-binding protein